MLNCLNKKVNEIQQYILDLNVPNNQEECIKNFKFIYCIKKGD